MRLTGVVQFLVKKLSGVEMTDMEITGVEVIDVEVINVGVTEVKSVGDTYIASEADPASLRTALFLDRGSCQTRT